MLIILILRMSLIYIRVVKKEKIPFTTGLATVAAERIFDICLLIVLFIITVNAVEVRPDINVAFGKYQLNRETLDFIFGSMLKLGVVLIAGIILVSIGKIREFFYGINRVHSISQTFGHFVAVFIQYKSV